MSRTTQETQGPRFSFFSFLGWGGCVVLRIRESPRGSGHGGAHAGRVPGLLQPLRAAARQNGGLAPGFSFLRLDRFGGFQPLLWVSCVFSSLGSPFGFVFVADGRSLGLTQPTFGGYLMWFATCKRLLPACFLLLVVGN